MAHRHGRTTTLGILGFAVLVSGCGLSEYEANMTNEQERIHRIDLENKYLEDPIEWPAKKEGDKKDTAKKETDKKDADKKYVDVFLRPPRGIERKPLQLQRGMLYEFPRSKDKPDPIHAIWIGAANDKDFVKDVAKFLPQAVGTVPAPIHEDRVVPGRPNRVSFDLTTFDDAGSTYVRCVYGKSDAPQAVVIFHLEKTAKLVLFPEDEKSESELATKIRLSLESLGVDQEAAKQRAAFNRYHSKARGK